MNITFPETVNKRNKKFSFKMVRNGPDVYPGAKYINANGGKHFTENMWIVKTINSNEGDVLHRHMVDGDAVLFNRQPTLHRMSMMCHIAKL